MKNKRKISIMILLVFILSQINFLSVYADLNGTPGLKVKVIDIKGDKPEYTGECNKILTNEQDIKLNGDASVTFETNDDSVKLKQVQYKFFKKNVQPVNNDFNSSDVWKTLDPDKNEIKKIQDVIKEKRGYVKWRSFNVSHMPNLSERDKWSNRSEVFKNPYDSIQFQSAQVSNDKLSYIRQENGRWIANTVFMKNFFIHNGYKEASKFWGYIKVPETGNYYFAIRSDDGSYGYIMIDKNKKDIVNRNTFFKPQSSRYGSTNTVFHLEKEKYYPIYLEYFNWGGSAHFQLYYRKNSMIDDWNKTAVPADWFYPSKTNTPGKYADGTFTINKGVKFPKEPGKYYIGIKNGQDKGVYGPFIVPPKAILEFKREVVNGNDFIIPNEEFEFKYTIKPQPLNFQDVGDSLTQLKVKEFKIEETFPNQIIIADVNGQGTVSGDGHKFTSNLKEIVYNKNTNAGKYEANPIEMVIRLRTNRELNNLELGNGSKAFAVYKDLDQSNEQVYLDKIKISTTKLRELNILEIQPTHSQNDDNFELEKSMFRGIAKQSDIHITKMSMPQFISSIEEINGKYDIVYIGSSGGQYSYRGNTATKLPQGGKNGTDSLEYYSENDITNNRAQELKEFIESGQLIIFTSGVLNNNQTKLYSNFIDYKNKNENSNSDDDYNNFVVISGISSINNIGGKNIKQTYNECSKRPILTLDSKPNDYDSGSQNYESTHVMNFRFDLENLNETDGHSNLMNIKLYIDVNGDGFFKEDEMVKEIEPKLDGKGYVLDYHIEDSFTGMMPWKLEIEDNGRKPDAKVKSYKTGYPAYSGDKLKVRVLHLMPTKTSNTYPRNGSLLHITNEGNKFIPPLSTDQYEIKVTELPVEIFDSNYPNEVTYNGKNVKTRLNGNYDMIIMGFNDSYGYSDMTSQDAIRGIKEFIKTGQSVMFTHDVFTFETKKQIGWGVNLTKEFRDIAGQSRYKDYNNPSELDLFHKKIPHDPLPNSIKKTYGFTNGALDRAKSGKFNVYTQTFKLNKGVITQYPYKLPDNLPVAKTHYQYYQLNLEDKNVIPWYTLNDNGNKKYDGRNYYYTYTKGNITYSGTGHSNPNGEPEHQFFVNTMIKAARNSNHAPTLEVINLKQDKIISKSQEKIEFTFIPDDIDGDPLTGEIYINDTLIESYSEHEIKLNEPKKVVISRARLQEIVGENEQFVIKIVVKDPKGAVAEENESYTLKYFENPVLEMKIDKDQKYLAGDTAEVKLQITTQKTSENLNTEIKNIQGSLSYENLQNQNAIQLTHGSKNFTLNNIIFNPEPQPKIQEKTFRFKLNNVDKNTNYTIKNVLNYDYSNFNDLSTQTKEFSYPISVKPAKINIQVVDTDGKAVGSTEIKVTKSDGNIQVFTTDQNGFLYLKNQLTGTGDYTLEIQNLPSKYTIKGADTKSIKLSYNNNVQVVKFELIDMTKIGVDLETASDGGHKCLVGDTVDINLTLNPHNENEMINTIIENITHSMTYISNALELLSSNNWQINDIKVFGKRIQMNEAQKHKQFNFRAKESGEYDVINTLRYNIEGKSQVRSITQNVSVKRGKIKVKVINYDGTPCKDVYINIKKDNNEISSNTPRKTNELGQYVLETTEQFTVSSGNYEVSIQLPAGFAADGGNCKTFNLSYDNAVPNVEFKLINTSVIINHGMFINKTFTNKSQVLEGFTADLGVEFKVYDKNPDVRLTLDDYINKVEFTLYKVDADGKITLAKNNTINLYKVNTLNGSEALTLLNKKIVDTRTIVDLSSISDTRKFKVELPTSDTFKNHYILKYTIHQNAPVRTKLNNNIKINNSAQSDFQIEVIPLYDLQ